MELYVKLLLLYVFIVKVFSRKHLYINLLTM